MLKMLVHPSDLLKDEDVCSTSAMEFVAGMAKAMLDWPDFMATDSQRQALRTVVEVANDGETEEDALLSAISHHHREMEELEEKLEKVRKRPRAA